MENISYEVLKNKVVSSMRNNVELALNNIYIIKIVGYTKW